MNKSSEATDEHLHLHLHLHRVAIDVFCLGNTYIYHNKGYSVQHAVDGRSNKQSVQTPGLVLRVKRHDPGNIACPANIMCAPCVRSAGGLVMRV